MEAVLLVIRLSTGLFVSAAWAQPTDASTDASTPRAPSLNLRVYPFDVWGPVAGWGVGAGVVVHNGVRRGDQWLLTAAPATHERVATLSFASASPLEATTYVLIDGRARTTDRQRFYGLGPGTQDDTRLHVTMDELWLRMRAGHGWRDRTLLLQPMLMLRRHAVRDVEVGEGRPFRGASATHFSAPLLASDRTLWGMQGGIRLAYDTRDRFRGTTRGLLVQASGSGYNELSTGNVQVGRLTFGAYGFLPLGGDHRLALRFQTTMSNSFGDDTAPFYLRPKLGGRSVPGLDHDRFFGADRVVTSVLYRFPLIRLRDLFELEGHVGAHAASVYDDLSEQFALDLSFDEQVQADDSVPLRPALSTGVRLGPLFRDETYFDLAMGISPEGVTGVRLQFIRPFSSVRPPHHNGATW